MWREGVALVEDSVFDGTVWPKYMETSEEEQGEHILEATSLTIRDLCP